MHVLVHVSGCPLVTCKLDAVVRDEWKRLSANSERAASCGPHTPTHVNRDSYT